MKAEQFKLCKNNQENRVKVNHSIMLALSDLDIQKDFEVIIKNYDASKSTKQRRLDWRWNTEIAFSGAGNTSDQERIHMAGKWMFARPLLLAGEDDYSLWVADMWGLILEKYPHDAEKQKNFFVYAVHTEKMTVSMVAEYLKNKQFYWTNNGVTLTDPSLAGL